MLEGLKTTILVLTLGLAGLIWGLGNLQAIFMAERDQAVEALAKSSAVRQSLPPAGLREEMKAINKRYRKKSSFVISCAMLGLIIAALAILAQRRKEKLAQMKSDFAATVSHELKTPLASIRLLAETMDRNGMDDCKDYPRRIVETADSLAAMVENILSFNRLEGDGWRLRKSRISLAQTAAWAMEEAVRLAPGRVKLISEGLEGEDISADPDLARLLFHNLARNAVQHGGAPRPEIKLVRAGGRRGTVIHFADNGTGIPKAEWDAVFCGTRLAGPDGSGKKRSGGLGLAICRRVMRAHGGDLSILSSGAEGTVFEINFP